VPEGGGSQSAYIAPAGSAEFLGSFPDRMVQPDSFSAFKEKIAREGITV